MLYRIAVLILLGVILLANKPERRGEMLKPLLLAQIDEAIESTNSLEKEANFKKIAQLRQQILSLRWMFTPLQLEEDALAINSNKFKVGKTDCYEKIGLLQLWEEEWLREKIIQTTDFETLRAFLRSLKKKTQTHDWQENHILTALLLDHYDLYLQTLTGSYHFQKKQALKDYQKVLQYHLKVLESLGQEAALESQYQSLIRFVKKQKFNDLDRFALLSKYIEPIHNQLIALIDKDYPDWISHLNIEQNLFSGHWLRADAFIDINDNLDREKLANLGQLLFFDPLLSDNNKRTCASCHQAQKAFSDGRSTSLGFDYLSKLDKNSPSLINAVYSHRFGHDLSKENLAAQLYFVVHQEKE
ncbi:MAG: cytochrome c peroxidase [Bacteroidota bacterium]